MIVSCPSCGAQNRIPPEKVDQNARCGQCHQAIPAIDTPYPVTSSTEFFEIVAKSSLPVLVDFWAEWCGPCRVAAPEFAKLAKERRGKLFVAKVNTDELTEVASRFGIQSIPTFVLFKGGQEAARASGAMPANQLARAVGL
jgi:thioredoxin 2